ncbi:MAG TPA: transposase [Phycisphaerae bacterium]|nr:transposase [Phycisphaerae bacterium]
MPRVARIVVPGMPHHITQRGNNRQDVFFVDDDRRMYLQLLKAQAEIHGLAVLGYCLMTNHVHLIGVPRYEQSLAKAVGRTHFLYSQYINRFHKRSGHLWQNRFFSCALDEVHLLRGLAYVERNPVRAKRVRVAWQYEWSSASAHAGGMDVSGFLDLGEWRRMWVPRGRSPVRRVGIHLYTFEACSGFTRVTARAVAVTPFA